MRHLLIAFAFLFSCGSPAGPVTLQQEVADRCFENGESFQWLLFYEGFYIDGEGTLHLQIAGEGITNVFVQVWKVTQPAMYFAGTPDKEGWVHIPGVGPVDYESITAFGHHPPGVNSDVRHD